MRKLRYYIRLSIAFLARFKGILFLGIIIGFFVFIALRILLPAVTAGRTERIGKTGRYRVDEIPGDILRLAGDGLTRINEKGELSPGLAEEWSTSDKGKTWAFKIKEGLVWQDGSEVTSETINYNFGDAEIETPDKYSLVFKLENEFSPFPTVVARPTFKKGFLGTGEWEIKKIKLNNNFVETVSLRKGNDDRTYKFYPTEESLKLAFKLGEIDVMEELINPQPFDKWETVNVSETIKNNMYVAIFLNNQDGLFKNNKELRQALAYAIDKEAFGKRAFGPINPMSWAFNPQMKKYEYSKERAIEIIGDIPEETRNNINIELTTTPVLLTTAERIAEYWKEIGIKSTVKVSSIMPSEYQAYLVIYNVADDPDQYQTWHSTQVETNISKYNNQRIDKLLEDGRLELEREKRKEIYFDFQRYLLEDLPVIFLYHPKFYTVERK